MCHYELLTGEKQISRTDCYPVTLLSVGIYSIVKCCPGVSHDFDHQSRESVVPVCQMIRNPKTPLGQYLAIIYLLII